MSFRDNECLISLKPVAVFNLHDPAGKLIPHLQPIHIYLRDLFSAVFVSVTPVTNQLNPDEIAALEADPLFQVLKHQQELAVGEDFFMLYTYAAERCFPGQIMHLCFVDRLIFALQDKYRVEFSADIQDLKSETTPLLFQRSPAAWQSHPKNYRLLEQMVMQVSRLLFSVSLEFAWCHLAIKAERLRALLPHVKRRDLTFFAELLVPLIDEVSTQEVNWLAWEDPLFSRMGAQELKSVRESDVNETRKRLAYVLPMIELLNTVSKV